MQQPSLRQLEATQDESLWQLSETRHVLCSKSVAFQGLTLTVRVNSQSSIAGKAQQQACWQQSRLCQTCGTFDHLQYTLLNFAAAISRSNNAIFRLSRQLREKVFEVRDVAEHGAFKQQVDLQPSLSKPLSKWRLTRETHF